MSQKSGFCEGKSLVETYYSSSGVDILTEKVLVEICASHAETNESASSIARRLRLSKSLVKGVLAGQAEHDARNAVIGSLKQ